MQLPQLPLLHGVRRMREQTLCTLRLRERDHVADRIGAGHQSHDTIEAKGNATMRRCAILQRLQQKPEFRFGFLFADVERAEHFRLHVLPVDPDRASSNLPAVEDDIVRFRARSARIGGEKVFV